MNINNNNKIKKILKIKVALYVDMEIVHIGLG